MGKIDQISFLHKKSSSFSLVSTIEWRHLFAIERRFLWALHTPSSGILTPASWWSASKPNDSFCVDKRVRGIASPVMNLNVIFLFSCGHWKKWFVLHVFEEEKRKILHLFNLLSVPFCIRTYSFLWVESFLILFAFCRLFFQNIISQMNSSHRWKWPKVLATFFCLAVLSKMFYEVFFKPIYR